MVRVVKLSWYNLKICEFELIKSKGAVWSAGARIATKQEEQSKDIP